MDKRTKYMADKKS